jgi:hypothetical protein
MTLTLHPIPSDSAMAHGFYDRLGIDPYARRTGYSPCWVVYAENGQRLNSTSFLLVPEEVERLRAMLPAWLALEVAK